MPSGTKLAAGRREPPSADAAQPLRRRDASAGGSRRRSKDTDSPVAALSVSLNVMVPNEISLTIKPVPPRLLYRILRPSALRSDISRSVGGERCTHGTDAVSHQRDA